MIEIKQIIKSRIADIKALQQLISNSSLDPSSKYQTIACHKKLERMRTIKETELLCSLNQVALNSSKQIQEFYDFSVQICELYDNTYNRYYEKMSVSMKQNIRILYGSFFKEHGFSYKLKQLNQILECDLAMISPSMFFGWLGEWSKKIYSDMLQNELRKQITKKKEASFSDFRQYKNFKIDQARSFQSELQKSQQSVQLELKNKAFKKGTYRPQIFIHNRENVYGYMLEDMMTVYKFYGFEDLDFTLLKTIKKLGKKNELLEQNNLQLAAQMLINTSNQQIKKSINEYYSSYRKKYPAMPKKKISSNSSYTSPKKIIRRQPTEINQKNNQQQVSSPSKLLSPKISQFQFIQQRVQSKIKRLKIISRSQTKKFNVQFPIISKKRINNDSSLLPSILEIKQRDKKTKLLKYYKDNQYERINASQITIVKPNSKTIKLDQDAIVERQSQFIGQMLNEDSFKKQLKYIFEEKIKQEQGKYRLKNFNPEQLRKKVKLSSLVVTNQ